MELYIYIRKLKRERIIWMLSYFTNLERKYFQPLELNFPWTSLAYNKPAGAGYDNGYASTAVLEKSPTSKVLVDSSTTILSVVFLPENKQMPEFVRIRSISDRSTINWKENSMNSQNLVTAYEHVANKMVIYSIWVWRNDLRTQQPGLYNKYI